MPYRDREKQRAYQREYSRSRRLPAGVCQTPARTPIPPEFRLQTARDVLDLLTEQIQAVRADAKAGTLERARCVGYLAGIALKAVETADMAERVEALERVLKTRKEQGSCPADSDWPRITGD